MPNYSSVRTCVYYGDHNTFTPNWGEVIISAVSCYNPSTGESTWHVTYGIIAPEVLPSLPCNPYGAEVLYELDYLRRELDLYKQLINKLGLQDEVQLQVEEIRMRKEILKEVKI